MYMQMELEAENWWLQSIGYDFDGKKSFIKNIVFFLSKILLQKTFSFFVGTFFRFPIVNNRRTRTRNLRNLLKFIDFPLFLKTTSIRYPMPRHA